jgi:hypothetical protein
MLVGYLAQVGGAVRYSICMLMDFMDFYTFVDYIFVMSPRQMRPTDRLGPLFTASMYESFVFSFVPPGFDDHNA